MSTFETSARLQEILMKLPHHQNHDSIMEDQRALTAAVNLLGSGWSAYFEAFPLHPQVHITAPDGKRLIADNWVNGPEQWEFLLYADGLDGDPTHSLPDVPTSTPIPEVAQKMAVNYSEGPEALG